MATVVTKEEAYARPTDLFDRAMEGEEIVIAQAGEPRFKLVPVEEAKLPARRRFGSLKGLIHSTPEHFAPLTDEELKDWGY